MNMKKIFAMLAVLTLSMVACADRHQLIQYSDLPVAAQEFIQKYFNASDISHIERERDGLHYEYSVHMKNATKIDFDQDGNMESVDCQISPVPEGIVPDLIVSYVSLQYPYQFIVEYAVEYRRLKVELSAGLDLVFDRECNFIGIDD